MEDAAIVALHLARDEDAVAQAARKTVRGSGRSRWTCAAARTGKLVKQEQKTRGCPEGQPRVFCLYSTSETMPLWRKYSSRCFTGFPMIRAMASP